MHVILGAGNLGLDLEKVLKEDNSVELLSASNGFTYPGNMVERVLNTDKLDTVWCTLGAGSVGEAKKDFKYAMDIHAHLPWELMTKLPEDVSLVLFSTDYVAGAYGVDTNDNPDSLYAVTKLALEKSAKLINRPKTILARITSLYGEHKKEKCFPYKLKNNFPTPCEVQLPSNKVIPTPTDWLAKTMYSLYKKYIENSSLTVMNVAPRGEVSVRDWGKLILGPEYEVVDKGYDSERPRYSMPLTLPSLAYIHWKELWDKTWIRI